MWEARLDVTRGSRRFGDEFAAESGNGTARFQSSVYLARDRGPICPKVFVYAPLLSGTAAPRLGSALCAGHHLRGRHISDACVQRQEPGGLRSVRYPAASSE